MGWLRFALLGPQQPDRYTNSGIAIYDPVAVRPGAAEAKRRRQKKLAASRAARAIERAAEAERVKTVKSQIAEKNEIAKGIAKETKALEKQLPFSTRAGKFTFRSIRALALPTMLVASVWHPLTMRELRDEASKIANHQLFQQAQGEITELQDGRAAQALKVYLGPGSGLTDDQYKAMGRQLMALRAYVNHQNALDDAGGSESVLLFKNVLHAADIVSQEAAQAVEVRAEEAWEKITNEKAHISTAPDQPKKEVRFDSVQPEDLPALAIMSSQDPTIASALDGWSKQIISEKGLTVRGDSFRNRVMSMAVADLIANADSYRNQIDDPGANLYDLALEAADLALAHALDANHATREQAEDILKHTYLFSPRESLTKDVAHAIRIASQFRLPGVKDGLSEVLLLNIMRGESGWRAAIAYFNKKTQRFGATGLGQFTDETWVNTIKVHGRQIADSLDNQGMHDEASRMRELVHMTRRPGERATLLEARTNPLFNAECTSALIQEAKQIILHALPDNQLAVYVATTPEGLRVTLTTGATNMIRLIKNGLDGRVERVMTPIQIKDNPDLLKGTLGDMLEAQKRRIIPVPEGELLIEIALKGQIPSIAPAPHPFVRAVEGERSETMRKAQGLLASRPLNAHRKPSRLRRQDKEWAEHYRGIREFTNRSSASL